MKLSLMKIYKFGLVFTYIRTLYPKRGSLLLLHENISNNKHKIYLK